MREDMGLYRGKRKDNGEWVYGDLIHGKGEQKEHLFIWYETDTFPFVEEAEVIPETVGQYTGLTDKNGKKVFEGDIIQVELGGKPGSRPCPIYFGEYIDADSDYDDYRCIGFYIKTPDGCGNIGMLLTGEFVCEVIGNIFDNPELLEGKK